MCLRQESLPGELVLEGSFPLYDKFLRASTVRPTVWNTAESIQRAATKVTGARSREPFHICDPTCGKERLPEAKAR